MEHDKTPTLTTSTGSPVDDNKNSLTAGEYGPILLSDVHLIDKLAHFDRERIPERVAHAKGAGAHGYFEVTNDVTKYCKANFLNTIGKKTPVFIRFSTVGGEKGSADTERDPRGYAIKFYTEEGNYDVVGNNTPVFTIRDPMQFPDFTHIQKKHPQTNMKCANMYWDFLSLTPEGAHQTTILFSERGTPDGYRYMHGFGTHTFRWVNDKNEVFFVKIRFVSDIGCKNLTSAEAVKLKGEDPDYATRDLFDHIASGKSATWTMKVQCMPEHEAENYRWNIFDPTKVWPHADYPVIEVGKVTLNKNPENFFAEVEQSAFSPSNFVPGIEASAERLLAGRMFSYPDSQRHRLGGNFEQLPINCPYRAKVSNGIRDGFGVFNGNQGSKPNYEPNTFGGSKPHSKYQIAPFKVTGLVQRFLPRHPNCDFAQPGALFRKVMTEKERTSLIDNLVGHMKKANRDIQERQVKIFHKCDPEYGQRLAQGLGFPSLKSKL
jgi:catalase